MKYDAVIFDLDGTLLDTLDDLKNAVNHALKLQNLPVRSREEIRKFIGNGAKLLIERAIGGADADVEKAITDFKNYYAAHLTVETRPYDGIADAMKKIRAMGLKIGINSNKYHAAIEIISAHYLGGLYDIAWGERDGIPKKPSPMAALLMLKELGVSPERAIYIGDSEVDIETAKNAGMDGAWVSWGLRHYDEIDIEIPVRIDTPDRIIDALM